MQRQRNEDSFGIMGPRIGPPRRREECSRQGLLGRTFLSAGDRRLERGSDVTRFQCTSPPSTAARPAGPPRPAAACFRVASQKFTPRHPNREG